MDDIARDAGVAKGTLYIYFTSKEQLFTAISEHFQEVMTEKLLEASELELPVREKIRALMDARIGAILRWKTETPHAQELMATHDRLINYTETDTYGFFRSLIAKALKEGMRQGELDPKAAGLSFEAAVDTLIAVGAGAAWRSQPKVFSEQLERSIGLCLRGMRP